MSFRGHALWAEESQQFLRVEGQSTETAEILRLPDQIGTPQDDKTGVSSQSGRVLL
ncbi:hypothetical protein SBA2_10047 [Acidobacteriia bacterium SbA2]|nr:hypothetical protein SBA2_10047 [Acidobacteriia bacterium SbA2]